MWNPSGPSTVILKPSSTQGRNINSHIKTGSGGMTDQSLIHPEPTMYRLTRHKTSKH